MIQNRVWHTVDLWLEELPNEWTLYIKNQAYSSQLYPYTQSLQQVQGTRTRSYLNPNPVSFPHHLVPGHWGKVSENYDH